VSDLLDRWRAAARADEGPALEARAREGLAGADSGAALRGLAVGAALLEPTPAERDRAADLVRWGLAAEAAAARWDAVHAAAALGLEEVAAEVAAIVADPAGTEPAVRARAVEALARLDPAGARTALEAVRVDDPDWTVRRLATDAQRVLRSGRPPGRGGPFARYRALVRSGRAEERPETMRLDAAGLARLGVRLPPALALFAADVFPGGTVTLTGEPSGALGEGASLRLDGPSALAERAADRAGSGDGFERLHEYVWERYVEGAKRYPDVDEDRALGEYGARYDGGVLDGDAWNYGVLLFESAFRDDARRTLYLRRARDVLAAWVDHTGEAEWDVGPRPAAEARDMAAEEGPPPAGDEPPGRFVFGRWGGVLRLELDLDRPGVWAVDPDSGERWLHAPGLAAFLNDPHGRRPGAVRAAGGADGALDLLGRAAAAMDEQDLKRAGRLFGDALERDHRTKAVLARAAELLERADMTPLLAAQLLATIPLVGDKKSLTVVRAALQALPAERAAALVEAAAPYDEDGSQVALFVDAAAGIRKRSHDAVRTAARRLKGERGRAHLRTLRNPWYKK